MEIPISPKIPLEVLFVLRDLQKYKPRSTGQFRYNPNMQIIHFQLRVNFMLVRLPKRAKYTFLVKC